MQYLAQDTLDPLSSILFEDFFILFFPLFHILGISNHKNRTIFQVMVQYELKFLLTPGLKLKLNSTTLSSILQ